MIEGRNAGRMGIATKVLPFAGVVFARMQGLASQSWCRSLDLGQQLTGTSAVARVRDAYLRIGRCRCASCGIWSTGTGRRVGVLVTDE